MARFPKFLTQVFGGIRSMIRPAERSKAGFGSISPDAGYGLDPMYQWFMRQLELGHERNTRYAEYSAMDEQSVEVSTALTYYADDATQWDRDHHATVWIESDSPEIQAVLEELLHDRLNVEDHIWGLARSLAKNGDCFRKIHYDRPEGPGMSRGVESWEPQPPRMVRRLENSRGELVGFKKDTFSSYTVRQTSMKDLKTDPNKFFNPWDFAHFRILGDDEEEASMIYGSSMLKNARPVWKRLKMLEEMLCLYRVQRAPDRLVFYVDVGDMSQEEALSTVRQWKRLYKKHQYINPGMNDFHSNYNPQALDEDIFWPIRKDTNSKVDRLQGGADVVSIADVEYFRDKMFLSLMIPREYLSGQGSAVIQLGGGQSLAQKDVRYARTIKRLQRGVVQGLTRICQIHLALLDLDPSAKRFKVKMSSISNLDEIQKAELLTAKLNVGTMFSGLARELEIDPAPIKDYVFGEILGLDQAIVDAFVQIAPPTLPPEAAPPEKKEKPKDKKKQEDVQKLHRLILENGKLQDDLNSIATMFGDSIKDAYSSSTVSNDPLPGSWETLTEEELMAAEEETEKRENERFEEILI